MRKKKWYDKMADDFNKRDTSPKGSIKFMWKHSPIGDIARLIGKKRRKK